MRGRGSPTWIRRRVSATGSRHRPPRGSTTLPLGQVHAWIPSWPAAYDEIDDVEFSSFHVDYRRVPGERRGAPPASQSFWAASVSGEGAHSTMWDIDNGQWAVVLMNADASEGVSAEVSVGAPTGLLPWIGVGLIIVAGLFATVGTVALRAAATGTPRPTARSAATPELEPVR